MRYVVLIVLGILLAKDLPAQEASTRQEMSLSAREQPAFPGGAKELKKYLSLNLRYPNRAMELKIEGEVIISFIIDEQGNVQNVRTVNGIGYGCDEEAIRVVKAMPQWRPASRDGKGLRVLYRLPVVFELPSDKDLRAD